MNRTLSTLVFSCVAAISIPCNAGVIHSCINKASGMIKVVAAKAACPRGSYAQELATPEATTPPPASTLGVEYVTGTTVPNTSVSRALCPPGTLVAGGGGITVQGAEHALQQSFPISDSTGVIAWGSTAIGWQVAADDWSDTQAFVVCLRP